MMYALFKSKRETNAQAHSKEYIMRARAANVCTLANAGSAHFRRAQFVCRSEQTSLNNQPSIKPRPLPGFHRVALVKLIEVIHRPTNRQPAPPHNAIKVKQHPFARNFLSAELTQEVKMKKALHATCAVSALVLATTFTTLASAQVTFYENEGFRGRVFSTGDQVSNFSNYGFNDRSSSVVVERGRWEVCDDARHEGRCVILTKGSYDTLRSIGMDNRISSVRPAGKRRDNDWANYESQPSMETPNYDWRRRPSERVYSAPVTSARAVMGSSEQRCWMERQQVQSSSNDRNVGGAILGGILGGVLGHQVGGGRGQDLATAGGAVAGAVIGSNVNRNNNGTYGRDVQRCTTASNDRPEYWDVTYRFRDIDHRVQMTSAPGYTIAVNANGEPRQ